MLADTTYLNNGKVSNKLRHTFWFPDKDVKKDQLVSVWTKPGTDTTSETDSGTKIHRFFWGLNRAVWNDTGDCAILFALTTWQFFEAVN
jgi:hypothetical protein